MNSSSSLRRLLAATVSVLVLSHTGGAFAQPLPEALEAAEQGSPSEGRMLGGHPDLSGSWEIIDPLRREKAPAELTAEAKAFAAEDRAKAAARLAAGFQVGIGAYLCQLGIGTPWSGQSEPLDIVQTPDETLIIIERLSPAWHVWTDGRSLPDLAQLPPSYNGYSVGRWEGDTFVVETTGIRTIDTNPRPGVRGGGYTTPKTKLTLRINLIGEGKRLYMTATYALGYFCDPTDPVSTVVATPPPQ